MKKRGKIEDVVLKTIAVAGIIAIGLVVPNALKIFKDFAPLQKKRNTRDDYIKNKVLRKLQQKKLVTFKIKDGQKYVQLTQTGKKLVDKIKYQNIQIKKPKKWDKKWRVIIFDIKERRRKTRNQFRQQIQSLGFVQLQRSAWVHPYPCDSIIKLFKTDLLIGKDILYMVVDVIENDKWLKEEFDLT